MNKGWICPGCGWTIMGDACYRCNWKRDEVEGIAGLLNGDDKEEEKT